jgi:hypothetical protein
MARPPSSLPPTTSAPLKVTLVLGSFVHTPTKFELFDLYLPLSHPAPQHPDEPSFHLLPTIEHTFRPDPKLPPRAISAFFAGLVISPWFILIGLVCLLFWAFLRALIYDVCSGTGSTQASPIFSLRVSPFLLSSSGPSKFYWSGTGSI